MSVVVGMGTIYRLWLRWDSVLSVVAEKEKLPSPRGFSINAQFRLCMNVCILFFSFSSFIRLWLGGFFNFFFKFPLRWCFVLFPSVTRKQPREFQNFLSPLVLE